MNITQKLPEFSTLYSEKNLKDWRLPAFAEMDPAEGIFRQPYIKWSSLPKKMNDNQEVDLYFVCADVLEIDADVNISTGTFLFARRIVLKNQAKLLVHHEYKLTSLLIVTNQITDGNGDDVKLPLVQISSEGDQHPTEIYVNSVEQDLTVFEISQGENILKRYPVSEIDPAYLLQGQPLRMFLQSELHLGILLMNKYQLESIHQFDFVGAVAASNPETQIMAGEARALAVMLRSTQAISKNALLVPLLDYTIYAASAASALSVLEMRQYQYSRLLDNANNLEQWQENAELMFNVGDEEKNLTRELLLKAEKTCRQMEEARAIAARQVAAIQVSLIYKRGDFEYGVEMRKEDLIKKDIFEIILGGVKILGEIGTLVATGPAAIGDLAKTAGNTAASLIKVGASIAESAINGIRPYSPANFNLEEGELQDMQEIIDGKSPKPAPVLPEPNVDDIINGFKTVDGKALKAAEKARSKAVATQKEKTDQFISSVKNVAGAGKEIADAAIDIANVIKQAAEMEAASQQALLAINKEVDKSFSDIAPRGLDMVTGGSQEWDKLSLLVKKFFNEVPNDVGGKVAFEQEYDRLIIGAQAMCQARLALAKANSDLAEAMIRYNSAEKTTKLYKDRLVTLKENVTTDKSLQQLAFNKILDAKRTVYLYMEAYRRAFIYFTLHPEKAPALPDLSSSYDSITVAVKNISNARLGDEAIGNAPKNMNKIKYRIDGDMLTEEFRQKGVLQFKIEPNDQLFDGHCRIRINEMEVYLEGYKGESTFIIALTNNGVYSDLDFGGLKRNFVMAKYKSLTSHDPKDPSSGFSGSDADRFKDEFSSRTPFSTWTIVFSNANKGPMDLSQVSAVIVVYSGVYSDTP